jgi:hypothetical protein
MPFTISHAVIAPPLAKLSRNTLPIAALAIGSMTPIFIAYLQCNQYADSSMEGAFLPNLALGYFSHLVFTLPTCGLPFFWYQHDLKLDSFRHFFSFFIGIIIALLIGTATHLIWDGLPTQTLELLFSRLFIANCSLVWPPYPLHRIFNSVHLLWHYLFRLDEYSLLSAP